MRSHSFLCAAVLFLSPAVHSAEPDFSICEGLSGAARGLCRAGVAAGCADGTGDPAACMSIEENFAAAAGEPPPWLPPPNICPCDYSAVQQTAAAWSDDAGNPKVIVFHCDAAQAWFQAANPEPQLPVVNALITVAVPSERVCQAVDRDGVGNVVGELSADELAACRTEVIDYAGDFLALFPGWPWVDDCSPP